MKNIKIAVIGLGYVGLPVSVSFSKKYEVIGYDIDIKRISYLAKLKLPIEKEEFYANSLKDIIKWVDNLKQIDTSEVKPLHNVTENTESIRNDEVEKNNSVEDVLNNAPERANNFFKVPKVVE